MNQKNDSQRLFLEIKEWAIVELYSKNWQVSKSLEGIYSDLNAISLENGPPGIFPILPPLNYKNQFIKGIMLCSNANWIFDKYLHLIPLFHIISGSQWCSYSNHLLSDGLMIPYDNPERDGWFYKKYPERRQQFILPVHEADWTNERFFKPDNSIEKDIDLLLVSRFQGFKNMELLPKILISYHKKYKKIKVTIPFKGEGNLNSDELICFNNFIQGFREANASVEDYVNFIPQLDRAEMPKLYQRAKLCILLSLIEGKNRSLHEAMLCNLPVICWKNHNQYARGKQEVFPDGAGEYVSDFSIESFVNTIHWVISNPENYSPRKSYLESFGFSGRKDLLRKCLKPFQYYSDHIPQFLSGDIFSNLWFREAMEDNYNKDLQEYIYTGTHGMTDTFSARDTIAILSSFEEKFKTDRKDK
jgi:glycosyltransferase involved in cell wall biosynthesis